MVSQITATLTKTFGSMFNLVCSLPMGLVRVVVYVVSSIAGAIRVFFRTLKEFFTGKALRVMGWLCSQIWSGLLSLGTILFNCVMYIWAWLPVGLAVLWMLDKANILPPEYRHYVTMAYDFIQFVRR